MLTQIKECNKWNIRIDVMIIENHFEKQSFHYQHAHQKRRKEWLSIHQAMTENMNS